MTDQTETQAELERLRREVTELSGLALATGVILTQLLQKTCLQSMSPQRTAGEIVEKARDGIEAFTTMNGSDPAMKKRALEAVQQYEDQIRSVLPI